MYIFVSIHPSEPHQLSVSRNYFLLRISTLPNYSREESRDDLGDSRHQLQIISLVSHTATHVSRLTGATSLIKPFVSLTKVGVRRSCALPKISVRLVISAGVTNPLTELSKVGSSLSKPLTASPPKSPLAVLIKAFVWFVVGAAKRVDKSVTTASMLLRLCAESNVSMAPMEDVSAERRSVRLDWRSTKALKISASLAERETGSGSGAGEVSTIAGRTSASGKNFEKSILSGGWKFLVRLG